MSAKEKTSAKSKQNPQASSVKQVQELTEDLKRVQAEFINYKSRVETEKANLADFSKGTVIKDLLPVIDDLERALAHLPANLTEDKWAQGVQKVHARLLQQLEKMGVKKMDALSQPFDPELHNAVQVEGEGVTQTVTEVLQDGYIYSGQVIRHAVVKVTNS